MELENSEKALISEKEIKPCYLMIKRRKNLIPEFEKAWNGYVGETYIKNKHRKRKYGDRGFRLLKTDCF
jgi:hypothetical protein